MGLVILSVVITVLLCVICFLLWKLYSINAVPQEQAPAKKKRKKKAVTVKEQDKQFVGVKLPDGSVLEYIGDSIPGNLVDDIDESYLVTKD